MGRDSKHIRDLVTNTVYRIKWRRGEDVGINTAKLTRYHELFRI